MGLFLACLALLVSNTAGQLALPSLYFIENDIDTQLAALTDFYYATNGSGWALDSFIFDISGALEAAPPALIQLLTDPNVTRVQKETMYLTSIYSTSNNISAELRLALYGLGALKHQWFTPGTSYCTWAGVFCCMTGSEGVLEYCTAGLNSVAWILLPGVGISGAFPSDFLARLPDLQLLILPENPGLIGRFPDMNQSASNKFQAFDTSNCGFSQPCAINSPKYGGSPEDINVETLAISLPQYDDCLPDFLDFDTTALDRISYTLDISCPKVKWHVDPVIAAAIAQTNRYVAGYGNLFVVNVAPNMYSFAGCICTQDGFTAMTSVNSQGERQVYCKYTAKSSAWKTALYIGAAVVGTTLLTAGLLLYVFKSTVIKDIRVWELNRLKSKRPPGTLPLGAGKGLGLVDKEITVVVSDVEGSTDLWEQYPGAMSKALDDHDKLLRQTLKRFYGYEITTEGDAFIIAFHDAIDALGFAMNLQEAMMDVPWSPEILSNPHAALVISPAGERLFNGLRVRLAIHTGIPTSIQVHSETKQTGYSGAVVELTEAISKLPTGGQCAVSGTTFQRLLGRLHEVQSASKKAHSKVRTFKSKATSHADTGPSSPHIPTENVSEATSPSNLLQPSQASAVVPDSSGQSSMALLRERSKSILHRRPGGKDGHERLLSELHETGILPMDVTIIDEGRFFFMEFSASLDDVASHRPIIPDVQILQVLPSSLACRSLEFPAFDNSLKVSPGFFDAPSAAMVQLPGRLANESQPPPLTIAFCNCCTFKEVAAADLKLAQRAQARYKSCVRTTLRLASGYECQDLNGVFMLAFQNATHAVQWAMLFNMALLQVDWDEDILAHPAMKEVMDSNGRIILKGMSAAIGICHGPVIKVCPHTTTGRADYFGTTVNRAARIFAAAQAGQVLLETDLANQVVAEMQSQKEPQPPAAICRLNYRLLAEDRDKQRGYCIAPEIMSKGVHGTRKSTMDGVDLAKHPAGAVSESVSNIFRTRMSGTPVMSRQPSCLPPSDQLGSQDTPSTWTIDVPDMSSASDGEATTTSHTPPIPKAEPRQQSSNYLTKSSIKLGLREQFALRADQHGQHTPPKRVIAGEGDSTSFVWQGVNLDVYSLGSFQFKGMAGNREIAQVLPSALGARLELFSHVLKRSKATCIRQDDTKLHAVQMWMPDITDMQMAT